MLFIKHYYSIYSWWYAIDVASVVLIMDCECVYVRKQYWLFKNLERFNNVIKILLNFWRFISLIIPI
jgi:hypothetical protein